MRVLCAYSGLEFNVQYFPGTLFDASDVHPIFHLQQKKLLSFVPKWAAREITEVDTYLLYLSLMHSTGLMKWRVSTIFTKQVMAQIEQTMEPLIQTIGRLNVIRSPTLSLPHFVISPDTRTLSNVHYWITAWDNAFNDWNDGYRSFSLGEKLRNREAALEKLIKNPHRKVESYANILADWASIAGEFPESTTLVNGSQVPLSDYWKRIIRSAASDYAILDIPGKDLEELIDHCRSYVENGTIFSHTLFNFLERAREKQRNPLGLGETTFRILDADSSVEDANRLAMIDNAPANEPLRHQYETKFQWLRARLAWQEAQRYKKAKAEKEQEMGL